MATFCIIKEEVLKFKQALKDGTINPGKLAEMTSAERTELFSEFVNKEEAKKVNALFESKLLLKNKKQGFITWAKTVAGLKPETRRDLLSKIEKMDERILEPENEKVFLNELASAKLGLDVTLEEVQTISDLAKQVVDFRAKVDPESPVRSKDRMAYGEAVVAFKNYVGDLQVEADKMSLKEYIKNPKELFFQTAGITKGIVSTLDNSFFGRQGIKTLYLKPDIWAKNFAKSWVDIGKQLIAKRPNKLFDPQRDPVMTAIRADIYSRPNALNGKYNAARNGYGLGVQQEEAFPISTPERIPILGRLFKASEVAFGGGALRIRADLADSIIKLAEKNGVDTMNKREASSLGKLVSAITGRGDIGKLETLGREINAAVFSIKFLKSNFDTLTAHQLDGEMTTFAKKQAAKNLLRIAGTMAVILGVAYAIDPDSVDFDPRSGRFGKIKIGGRQYDISGGMGSLLTLAARIVPTVHDGELGWWTKNAAGQFQQLSTGEFGKRTALDVIHDFWEGKASPFARVFLDMWRGENFQGNKPTIASSVASLITPIPIQTFSQLQDASFADALGTIIGETLGFGVGKLTYGVSGAITKLVRENTEKRQDGLQEMTAKDIAKEVYGENYTKAQLTEVIKLEQYYKEYGFKNSKANRVMAASTNDGKAQLLEEYKREMTPEEFNEFYKKGRKKVTLASGGTSPVLISDALDEQFKEVEKIDKSMQGEQTNKSFVNKVVLYAKALGTDPLTAFNRIVTGQKIRRIDNKTIIVERMSLAESQKVKKERKSNTPDFKLDHTLSLELGGSNTESNLKIVPTAVWETYTPVENYLGDLLRAEKISKKDAQNAIKSFKDGTLTFDAIKGRYPQ